MSHSTDIAALTTALETAVAAWRATEDDSTEEAAAIEAVRAAYAQLSAAAGDEPTGRAREALADAAERCDLPRRWTYAVDGVGGELGGELTAEQAEQAVRDMGLGYDADTTVWEDCSVTCALTGEHVEWTQAHDPREPSCEEDEHAWEQTSVRGHGGGAIVTEACSHCGCVRVTDTWAQRPDTGKQGLRSVSYEVAQ